MFGEHLSRACAAGASVATFPNLGNDAILVAPCATTGLDFAHFASFIRRAPSEQAHALLAAVGAAVEKRLAEKRASGSPLWVSTSGAGVSWLHVRLDDRPKYYTFAPYRSA